MLGAIVSDAVRGNLTDLGLLGGVIGAVAVPAGRWLQRQIRHVVADELRDVKDAVVGHQRTLEGIARNELAQLLPNGGSSMRDQLVEIRDILKKGH